MHPAVRWAIVVCRVCGCLGLGLVCIVMHRGSLPVYGCFDQIPRLSMAVRLTIHADCSVCCGAYSWCNSLTFGRPIVRLFSPLFLLPPLSLFFSLSLALSFSFSLFLSLSLSRSLSFSLFTSWQPDFRNLATRKRH